MKYKSVKDLKDKISAAIEGDNDFEAHLFSKYPTLFPTDSDGNLLPQHQRCYNDCPDGWRHIVESLFGCIDNYIKNTSRSVPNPNRKMRAKIRQLFWKYVRNPIYKTFNPYSDFEKRLRGGEFISLTEEDRVKINKTFAARLRSLINKIDRKLLDVDDLYISIPPPQTVIEQYKEKYGTLRVYHDGGDDEIRGMTRYAEYLSSITCQETGKIGQLCKRGMWYSTLSPARAKKLGYKPVKEL